MTVQQFSGNAADNAIGLIATSKHQSGNWKTEHKPRMDWASDPRGLGLREGAGFDTYLKTNLGFDSTRWQRGTPQFTGHTALFVRRNGNASWARGWVPQPGISSYYQALWAGGETPGMWRDDLFMIADPTCISVEFPVTPDIGDAFRTFFDTAKDAYTHYSFQVGATGHCNCVWAAVGILQQFAINRGLPFANRFNKVKDPKQGHMMQMVFGGELLMD